MAVNSWSFLTWIINILDTQCWKTIIKCSKNNVWIYVQVDVVLITTHWSDHCQACETWTTHSETHSLLSNCSGDVVKLRGLWGGLYLLSGPRSEKLWQQWCKRWTGTLFVFHKTLKPVYLSPVGQFWSGSRIHSCLCVGVKFTSTFKTRTVDLWFTSDILHL